VDDHCALQHSATMSAAPLRPSKRRVLNGLKMLQFQSPCALRSMIDFLLSARKLVVKPRDIRADPKSPAVASGAPSCLAPNKSQFNRCSVAPLPGTTPFFAGPAQRGAGRASDWGGHCAAARDAGVVPGTALVRLVYQGFGRNHQASTRRNPNVDPVQRERVNGAKADAYFGIGAPNHHGGE